jgi:hypothetical protein
MNGQACFDFSHVPDKELFNPDRGFWQGQDAERAAWFDEQKRRTEAKRLEQERLEQERLARRNAIKAAIPYSEALATEICERISCGELLIDICEDEYTPTMRRCNQWMKENIEFGALFKESINDRLNVFEEEVLKIADCIKNDWKTVVKNGKERRVLDPDVIARAKLRIDVRFRHLKALRPQKWGEMSTLTVKNEDDSFDPASMTQDELEKVIFDLERKSGVVKGSRAA